MNTKRYVIGSIIVFVCLNILDYLLHGVLLKGQYELIKDIFRAEEGMNQYMPAMLLGYLIFSFGFCYIFIKGREGKGVGEGLRYGLLVGFTFGVSTSLIYYTVYPLSGWIMLGYFFGYPIQAMILGGIFAAIYKPKLT